MVIIKLLTIGPVVSWRGWETTPPSIIAELSFFAQPPLSNDISLCGLPSLTFCLHLVDELVSSMLTKMSVIFSFILFY